MSKVFVATSHKGGTGRSVSMANVSYRLAAAFRQNVCLVDLDFASPTLGTVLGLKGYEAGAPPGSTPDNPNSVTDIILGAQRGIPPATSVRRALRDTDVWSNGALSDQARPTTAGELKLLAAAAKQGDPFAAADLVQPLAEIVLALKGTMDIIILDVRSGLSEPLRAALSETLQQLVTAYIFHFRWTPQQLNGLGDVLSSPQLRACPRDKIKFVKTAKLSTAQHTEPELRKWILEQDKTLQSKFDDVLSQERLDSNETLLGEVPMEPVLQWQETIITRRQVDRGVSKKETLEAFGAIAERIFSIPAKS